MNLSFPGTRRTRVGATVFALLLASQLAGCGGSSGSGGSASPPPSTPPGGNEPPAPTMLSLKLEGRVTDEPIANAEVTATIGGETFTTTADENGDYSLDVEIEEESADAFVVLSARGVGAQSFVEFMSLAGSFQSLLDQAGDDATLSSDEDFSTQITNVSTAEAVLLQQANGGNPVTSDAALLTLSNAVNAQDVLDLAAAIKLTVDNPDTYPMPEGQTSILELALDATARTQFINEVYTKDPAAFASTQAAIVQDAGLAKPISLEDDLSFTAALLSSDPDFSFNYTGRIVHFDLLEGGIGFTSSETYDVPLTWVLDGSKIVVTYESPIETISYDTENCVGDGGVRQVEAHYVSEGATIAFLSDKTVAITEANDITYADCASLEPRTGVTSTQARTILTMDSFSVIDIEEMIGEGQTFYVYDAAQGQVVADIAYLAADGTGTTRLTNQTFTWSLDDTGKMISVDFADTTHAEYFSLRDIDEFASDIMWEVRTPNDGPVYMGAGASVFLDPEYAIPTPLTEEAVAGTYYQFGFGEETIDDDRLAGFSLRFDADGVEDGAGMGSHQYDFIDLDTGEVVLINEEVYPYEAFRWTLEGQEIVVRRTWDTAIEVDNCVFGEVNCELYDERRLIPLVADDESDAEYTRVYWIEQRRFDFDGISADTPQTVLVRYYDVPTGEEAAASASAKPTRSLPAKKTRALLRGPQVR